MKSRYWEHRLRSTAWSRRLPPFAVLVVLVLAGCQGRQLMPTPQLYIDAADDPFAHVAPALRTSEVEVLYVTDRKAVAGDGEQVEYGYERSASLAIGSCTVQIGKELDWETLVTKSRRAKRSVSSSFVSTPTSAASLSLSNIHGSTTRNFPNCTAKPIRSWAIINQNPQKGEYLANSSRRTCRCDNVCPT